MCCLMAFSDAKLELENDINDFSISIIVLFNLIDELLIN